MDLLENGGRDFWCWDELIRGEEGVRAGRELADDLFKFGTVEWVEFLYTKETDVVQRAVNYGDGDFVAVVVGGREVDT